MNHDKTTLPYSFNFAGGALKKRICGKKNVLFQHIFNQKADKEQTVIHSYSVKSWWRVYVCVFVQGMVVNIQTSKVCAHILY